MVWRREHDNNRGTSHLVSSFLPLSYLLLNQQPTMRQTIRNALLLLLLPTRAASTGFQLHSDPTCSNGLAFTDVTVACSDDSQGGSSVCQFGESAHVSSSLTIPDTGLFGSSISAKACLYGMYPCKTLSADGDFCSIFGLEQYGCPSSGTYAAESTFDIPVADGLSLMSGMYVVVKATLTNDDGTSYYCQVRVDAVSTGSSSTAYMVGVSSVVLASLITALVVRKRRLRARIDLNEEEREGHFEMMKDGIVSV